MSISERFWRAFYDRSIYWSYLTDRQAMVLADMALAQAKFESADFSSNVFLSNNNPIGYKYYSGSLWQSGPGTGSPEGDKYGRYARVEDAAKELADWVHRRKYDFMGIESLGDYAAAMKANSYFGDSLSNYLNGLEHWFKASDYSSASNQVNPLAPVEETVKEVFSRSNIPVLIGVGLFMFILSFTGIIKYLRKLFR